MLYFDPNVHKCPSQKDTFRLAARWYSAYSQLNVILRPVRANHICMFGYSIENNITKLWNTRKGSETLQSPWVKYETRILDEEMGKSLEEGFKYRISQHRKGTGAKLRGTFESCKNKSLEERWKIQDY